MADNTAQAEAEKALEEHDAETERRMGADEYVVVYPYITAKVRSDGVFIVREFFEGGVFKGEDVEPNNLRHLVDGRMVAPKDHPDAKYAAPAGVPKPGEPPNVPVTEQPVGALPIDERLRRQREAGEQAERDAEQSGDLKRPHGNASEEKWLDYAVARRVADGAAEEDARAELAGKSKADLVAEFGG